MNKKFEERFQQKFKKISQLIDLCEWKFQSENWTSDHYTIKKKEWQGFCKDQITNLRDVENVSENQRQDIEEGDIETDITSPDQIQLESYKSILELALER